MTDQQHPITPPPELVRQWLENSPEDDELGISDYIATQAANWGADQELEACCEWLGSEGLAGYTSRELRTNRRPKPPSLKEQALAVIENSAICDHLTAEHETILRRALEQLDD